ncbi:NADPH:quinone oxidoreductase family protein [Erythrobacter insulae]|uniref:NADPH:quinone oxidoreductase family protein n=1 Tax=Erythrobacter insulae TaxID=2584124 RepID=A0A547PE51_9SPHN|nr:NADPH:quinone oxidoreductase family protein [Erythrobacter insulae]TRD12409.1 NADPH:quinone oxidoreductase family protein [Erythrobacter insulae]
MQALRVEHLSRDLSGVNLTDVPVPERQRGEALVKIRAASLNYPDLLMTSEDYQFKPEPPFTAGMELAGEVVDADSDSPLKPGDFVMGGAKTGGFAEYAAFPTASLRPMPKGVTFEVAAALGAAYNTAYTALVELGQLRAGQWVLIHGSSGGVGMAAVDLAMSLGAKVIAVSGSAHKLARIHKLYRPHSIVLAEGQFREQIAEITGGLLCDLVFDPVGGDIFDESTRCVAFNGKLLVVGFAGGRIASIRTNIPLIKGFSIVGVRAGEYARRFPDRGARIAAHVSDLAASGSIKPAIDRILPLSDWKTAFTAMAQRQLTGKVVMLPGA